MNPLYLHGRIAGDLVWAMEWLDSLTNDLNAERAQRNGDNEHPRTREFLDELAQRRTQSSPLDLAAQEARL